MNVLYVAVFLAALYSVAGGCERPRPPMARVPMGAPGERDIKNEQVVPPTGGALVFSETQTLTATDSR